MPSTLSLSVEPAWQRPASALNPRVIVRLDGEDVSRDDGNDGPDPWHVLVPVNRFVATGEPTTATVACCPSCGPDCWSIEARIRRDGDLVRWEWGRTGAHRESERRVTLFDGAAYDAEVARFEADRGWETLRHRAGRLIFAGAVLPPGIVGVRVGNADDGGLEVELVEPDEYQIFVRVPWDDERPGESAAVVRGILAGPPAGWDATYFTTKAWLDERPSYAGPSWQRMNP